MTLTISRHDAALVYEAAMVSEAGPVFPTPASAVDTSRSSSISATDVSVPVSLPLAVDQTVSTDSATVARVTVQSAGGPQLSPANPQLPSATSNRVPSDLLAARPLLVDVAAVAITTADLRGVPRLTESSDQNVPEILSHVRVIVGLEARVRPND